MKVLLYCTKGKPYLYQGFAKPMHTLDYNNPFNYKWHLSKKQTSSAINGTIPCECDYELEDIYYGYEIDDFWTKTCGSQKDIKHNLLKQSCLTDDEMHQYLQPKDSYYGDCGKAIHIKNLKIFDEPISLDRVNKRKWIKDENMYSNEVCDSCIDGNCKNCPNHYEWLSVSKAPQNMMYVFDNGEKKILISICPEWLCKILNGEKTIEIRKKVLKEM